MDVDVDVGMDVGMDFGMDMCVGMTLGMGMGVGAVGMTVAVYQIRGEGACGSVCTPPGRPMRKRRTSSSAMTFSALSTSSAVSPRIITCKSSLSSGNSPTALACGVGHNSQLERATGLRSRPYKPIRACHWPTPQSCGKL